MWQHFFHEIENILYKSPVVSLVYEPLLAWGALQHRAILVFELDLEWLEFLDAWTQKFENLIASKRWVINCAKNRELQLVPLWGKEGSIDEVWAAAEVIETWKNVAYYDASSTFNADETGPIYKLLPELIYIRIYENRNSICDAKPVKVNDTIKKYVFTNMPWRHATSAHYWQTK